MEAFSKIIVACVCDTMQDRLDAQTWVVEPDGIHQHIFDSIQNETFGLMSYGHSIDRFPS